MNCTIITCWQFRRVQKLLYQQQYPKLSLWLILTVQLINRCGQFVLNLPQQPPLSKFERHRTALRHIAGSSESWVQSTLACNKTYPDAEEASCGIASICSLGVLPEGRLPTPLKEWHARQWASPRIRWQAASVEDTSADCLYLLCSSVYLLK